jgi:hypothetical protein
LSVQFLPAKRRALNEKISIPLERVAQVPTELLREFEIEAEQKEDQFLPN